LIAAFLSLPVAVTVLHAALNFFYFVSTNLLMFACFAILFMVLSCCNQPVETKTATSGAVGGNK